jgi:hypothetical protein
VRDDKVAPRRRAASNLLPNKVEDKGRSTETNQLGRILRGPTGVELGTKEVCGKTHHRLDSDRHQNGKVRRPSNGMPQLRRARVLCPTQAPKRQETLIEFDLFLKRTKTTESVRRALVEGLRVWMQGKRPSPRLGTTDETVQAVRIQTAPDGIWQ